MRTVARLFAVAATVALLAAACGDDDDEASEESTGAQAEDDPGTTAAQDEGAAGGGAEVAVADTSLGDVVVDAEGLTLYVFDSDSGSESSCYDSCAETWPPLTTEGDPVAGEGADDALLGTTERTDGTVQVTYDGRPLYTYAADGAPGDTTGQGVGGVWWVVGPDGQAIEDQEAGSDTTAGSEGDPADRGVGVPGY